MSEETPVIRFFRGSKPMGTARVVPNTPIVEIAELAGVDIPTNCTSGNCGTCLVRLISGQVDLPTNCTSGNCGTCLVRLISGQVDLPDELPPGLDEDLVAAGGTLTCCILPIGSCEIDLIPPL